MTTYVPEGRKLNTEKNRSAMRSVENLHIAYEKGQVLEALVVLCDNDHHLHVNLGCMRGIIPREEGAIGIAEGTTRDIALISRVNKPVCFVVTDFKTDAYGMVYAVLSRRKVQEQCKRDYIANFQPGQIVDARVTHLEKFGAFVDIGCGMNSLVPIDMLSISRISHPSDRVREGDDLKLVVRSLEDNKITLSLRELLGTWEENAAQFNVGETVPGIIRSIEKYGVFIELAPNLAGLAEVTDNVKVNQHASVYIKSIIPEKMKIKLSIIDAFDAGYEPSPLQYMYHGEEMDYWRYSPEGADKVIETVF